MIQDRENLTQLFLSKNLSRSSIVSQNQIYNILSQKTPFPKDLFNELMIEIGSTEQITVEDIIDVYIKAFVQLDTRVRYIKQQINIYENKKNDLLQELQVARLNQNQNEYGIDDDSIVYCSIISAIGLLQGNYYVKIISPSQIHETQVVKGGPEIIFNEEFVINVKTLKDVISVNLMQNFLNKQVIVGSVVVPVYQMKDQNRQEDQHILEDLSGALGDTNKRLYLGLQWIHSKVNKIEEFLREVQYYQPHIIAEEENLYQTLSQIQQLKQPVKKTTQPLDLPRRDDCNCYIF